MSHPYGTWSSGVKHTEVTHGQRHASSSPLGAGSSRRSGNGDSFSYQDTFAPQDTTYRRSGSRNSPSTTIVTSSLSGAMGEMQMSPQRLSNSSSPSALTWQSSAMPETYGIISDDSTGFPYLAGTPPGSISSGSSQGAFVPYMYDTGISDDGSASHPTGLATSSYPDQLAYQSSRQNMMSNSSIHPTTGSQIPMAISPPPTASSPLSADEAARLEGEVRRLQHRVRELEHNYKTARDRVKDLEREVGRTSPHTSRRSNLNPSGLHLSSLPVSPAFQESWKARTEARVKVFCSLNRAGNALCSWHDSRRERRTYPPRMAPPGYLNCGCTFEEALFEESLSRHGVGSYHPGPESVRMDPALRNPLLKLLQQRFGYQDGDFERDPISGDWVEGEGASLWESKAASGAIGPKKARGEERR
ncbi:hypothetical protein C8Q75DRAFT_732993 [Abortiporus biennis]|nr:hypothetical protein C8Q75DRAFT_732993 [Abortiporus biennis]